MSSALLQLMATRGAAAAAWTPASLSNKVGWWRASDITGKSDGDSVTAWPDSFGLLSDATGSGTYRTGVNGIGGQPAIEFNATTNKFSTGYTGTPNDFFVFAVVNLGILNGRIFDKYYLGGVISGRQGTSTTIYGYILSNSPSGAFPSFTEGENSYLFLGRQSNTAVKEFNLQIDSYSLASTALSNRELQIGWSLEFNGRYFDGLISEVGFLDGYPSADDLTNLRAYVTDTYGIATS